MRQSLPIHDDLTPESDSGQTIDALCWRIWTHYVVLRLICWSFGVAALWLGAIIVANHGTAKTSISTWLLFSAATFVAFSHELIWQRFQNSDVGWRFVADLNDRIPNGLTEEMNRYSSGMSRARTSDGLVPIELFQSAFRIALRSPKPKYRALVRSKVGARDDRPLYPHLQASDSLGEPPEAREVAEQFDGPLVKAAYTGVRRWAPRGWIKLPDSVDLIAEIVAGADHPDDIKLQNALDVMRTHFEDDGRKKRTRKSCIKAAMAAFPPGVRYSESTLGQLYDGRYQPIFSILGMNEGA